MEDSTRDRKKGRCPVYKAIYMEEIEKLIDREMEDYEQYKLDDVVERLRSEVLELVRNQAQEFVLHNHLK